MGQQSSKHRDPLTFAYVNRNGNNGLAEEPALETEDTLTDFVLANPHLYKLEMTCQNGCQDGRKRMESNGSGSSREESTELATSVVVATKVDQECEFCRQNKRLSLVRRDLAKDLAYIDETYYSDVIHYVSNEDASEIELLQLDHEDDQGNTRDDNWGKLTIGEVTPGKARPRRLTGPSLAVDLSGKSLIKLSPSIGYLDNLTKLNLSNNQMTSLPKTIGYLKNLRVLNCAHNQLEYLPDTIVFMTKLTALNVSHNNLTSLPKSIGSMPKLVVIVANDNRLTCIPREIANLQDLISLNVSNNPLPFLPAEVGNLKTLRKLTADGCNFNEEFIHELRHDPPSLLETCARQIVRAGTPIPNNISGHIKEYFAQVQTCSFCGGPYFNSYVTRGRFIERTARQPIALEYKLCAAHWSGEEDRLMAMFADIPATSPLQRSEIRLVDVDGLEPSNTPTKKILGRSRACSDASARSYIGTPTLTLSPSNSSQVSRRSNSSSSFFSGQWRNRSYSDLSETITIQSLKRQPSLPALPTLASNMTTGNNISRVPSPLNPRAKQRPRASSSASVTRRFTGMMASPPRSYSNSALRQPSSLAPPLTNSNRSMLQIDERVSDVDLENVQILGSADASERSSGDSEQQQQSGSIRLWTNGQSQSSAANLTLDEQGVLDSQRSGLIGTSAINVSNGERDKRIINAGSIRAGFAHIGARFSNRDRSGTV